MSYSDFKIADLKSKFKLSFITDFYIDRTEYYIQSPETIMAILASITTEEGWVEKQQAG